MQAKMSRALELHAFFERRKKAVLLAFMSKFIKQDH